VRLVQASSGLHVRAPFAAAVHPCGASARALDEQGARVMVTEGLRLAGGLSLDQPQNDVAEAFAGAAQALSLATTCGSSQISRSPLSSGSRSKPIASTTRAEENGDGRNAAFLRRRGSRRKSRPHPQVWGVEHSGRSSLYLPAAPDAPPGRQPSSRRKWPRPRGDVDGADAIWPPNGAARWNTDNNGRPSIDAREASRPYPEFNFR
jgi:hypothetical protein